jgi:enamine deaminase RidA (YjgF/YER057c/UK114 family)
MSHLKYYAYEGLGQMQKDRYWYSQAVRVGDRIECSGQGSSSSQSPLSHFYQKKLINVVGGWDPKTGELQKDVAAQIAAAFENVDINLKDAGGKGWGQVFSLKTYHVGLNMEALTLTVEQVKRWMPDHQPIWTVLGVEKLALPEMVIEVEVTAHDPVAV